MSRKFRPVLIAVVGLALPLLVVAIERGIETLGIAAAYKAKMLCSGIFVANRNAIDVLRELEYDDLAPLRFIKTTVDHSDARVYASAAGFIHRRAAYRPAGGCALVPRGTPIWRFQWEAVRDVPFTPREEIPLPSADSVYAGLDSVVARAFEEPDSTRLRRTQAVVVMQHGRIVAERYAPGISPETRLLGWSMTKSVMNALVGTLVRDGRISLDEPVRLPEWSAPGDPRRAITMRHLLHMTSGLRLNEVMNSLRSDVIRMLLANDDMAAFVASRDLIATPGSRWDYASGTTLIIARAIRSILDNDSVYARYPRDALFDRIGMSSAIIETDAAGTLVGSSLMYATARDWARFGQLYLNDGMWDGERILPDGWVEFTRHPAPADSNQSYGAHFWLSGPSEPGHPAGSPSERGLEAAGHEGQYLTILPSHDAVIVRLGRTRYGNAWNQATFVREVVARLNAFAGSAVK